MFVEVKNKYLSSIPESTICNLQFCLVLTSGGGHSFPSDNFALYLIYIYIYKVYLTHNLLMDVKSGSKDGGVLDTEEAEY
jgi:hypothetical protein